MIFNEVYGNDSLDNIKPSPYELGLEGALMHVYENECNYNAIIKSVGLAEMKYYAETGQDLFLNEAGALSGFFQKVKNFFKKVIEKIKAIFKKFLMVMNQYAMSDKQFANKYEKDVVRASLKDFEFKGWTFKGLKEGANPSEEDLVSITKRLELVAKYHTDINMLAKITQLTLPNLSTKAIAEYDSDDISEITEKIRGNLTGKGPLSDSEFRDELKEFFYGDNEKEVLDEKDINVREIITELKNNSKAIKDADRATRDAEREIKNFIKAIEVVEKELAKTNENDSKHINDDDKKPKIGDTKNEILKVIQHLITLAQNYSNIITVTNGIYVQALKDRARQNKAICVKLVGRKVKDESYNYYGSYDDSIFSDVFIR